MEAIYTIAGIGRKGQLFHLTTQLPNNQPLHPRVKGPARHSKKTNPGLKGHLNYFRIGFGQSIAQLTGHSARSSGVDGKIEGLIVVNLNGEGCGVTCRAVKPNGET
ncbi:MAG TPA: hypothetical protein VMR33_16755 [Candidatus Baltobacteraceae bacterium]|jgi:hypothetical protein|nr:hypothetical protein [Candidatus Baltobacteraceae bacterium]